MKIYEIRWKDHFSDSSWRDEDDIKEWVTKHKKKFCTTVGRIIYQDDDILVMCASDDGDDSYGDLMAIYKNHIIKKTIIRRK